MGYAVKRELPKNGVTLIASGEKFIEAALYAAASIRKSNPELGVALFSDKVDLECDDLIDKHIVFSDGHRRSKIDKLAESPFERTLYLDTDTRVIAPLDDMFEILDKFDLAIAHAHKRNKKATTELWKEKIPNAFPQLNGGVILYKKNETTQKFLKNWQDAFHTAGVKKDQVTLRELLWCDKVIRWTVLPPEFNVRYKKYLRIWDEDEAVPKILHYRKFHQGKNRILYRILKRFQ